MKLYFPYMKVVAVNFCSSFRLSISSKRAYGILN